MIIIRKMTNGHHHNHHVVHFQENRVLNVLAVFGVFGIGVPVVPDKFNDDIAGNTQSDIGDEDGGSEDDLPFRTG